MTTIDLRKGDSFEILQTIPENSIDAIITDPPYGLGFMGKSWDAPGNIAFNPEFWKLCLKVLKPGGHMVAFSGTRTYHRMACAIEDAGFEVRDQLAWVYGQGFPKSLDVSKAIDASAGVKGVSTEGASGAGSATISALGNGLNVDFAVRPQYTAATDAARQWKGWGTALKPAWEPICLARKPFRTTVAKNVIEHGTGTLNIDACRVGWLSEDDKALARPASFAKQHDGFEGASFANADRSHRDPVAEQNAAGRWPANLCHDGSDQVLECFPISKSGAISADVQQGKMGRNGVYGHAGGFKGSSYEANEGSAARFFYCAKASKADRAGSSHPTVKPVALMRWLCRLVTPPGGVILDPFAGSGTTGQAAREEGFNVILCEREIEYQADIERRLGLIIPGRVADGQSSS